MHAKDFTPEELAIVDMALEMWADQYEEATNEIILDRTHQSAGRLLEAVSAIQNDFAVTQSAIQKVQDEMRNNDHDRR